MSVVIFCLLFSSIHYVPVKGEIIWYLSLTAWLLSLSIMLSSFIHAIAKVMFAEIFIQTPIKIQNITIILPQKLSLCPLSQSLAQKISLQIFFNTDYFSCSRTSDNGVIQLILFWIRSYNKWKLRIIFLESSRLSCV